MKLACGCRGKVCRVPEHFFGSVFPTERGGLCTVAGTSSRKTKSRNRYYTVVCSICSLDTELFPYTFESLKGDLNKGKFPCGCSKAPKWSKDQWVVLVKRKCLDRGYIFRGFSGDWVKCKTRLKLECLKDRNVWDSTIINHFLNTNSGCPECGSKGSGKKKRTSQKDVENKIRKISAAEGLKTNGWVDEYVNAHSKFRWTCSSGHSCQTSVDKFIGGRERKGTRCPSCWDESNYLGYYPERADEQDNLYLLRFTRDTLEGFLETFIKIGRTFDIDRRMKEFRKSEYVIEVLAINQGTHREVYDTEQYYHSVGRDHHYKPLVDFAGSLRECFTLTVLDLITFED